MSGVTRAPTFSNGSNFSPHHSGHRSPGVSSSLESIPSNPGVSTSNVVGKLTPDEEEVRRLAFAELPSRKVLQLVSLGSWTTAAPGDRLIEHGTAPGAIALVVRGKVRVSKDGGVLGELGVGDIVGSALVLSGAPAEVDAVTIEPVRALRWEVATLRRYLRSSNPETRSSSSAISPVTSPESCDAWARIISDSLRRPSLVPLAAVFSHHEAAITTPSSHRRLSRQSLIPNRAKHSNFLAGVPRPEVGTSLAFGRRGLRLAAASLLIFPRLPGDNDRCRELLRVCGHCVPCC